MNTAATLLFVVAGVAAVIDWWAVGTDRLGVEFLAKPAVVIALIGAALAIDLGVDVSRVQQGVLIAALGASLVGDVVLMTPDARFEAGLGAFLVAHVLYIIAFVPAFEVSTGLAAAVLIVGTSFAVAPQLMAAVRRRGRFLTGAVGLYIVVVSVMGVVAAGTGVLTAAIGGALFVVSDALLGWGRFVGPAPGGRVLVHVTYHLGQAGLVSWLAV